MPQHPNRVVLLDGASNFRDLGGYQGRGGRSVRWRRLFRSDHLGALSAADKGVLAGLALTKAFDFRGVDERAAASYELSGVAQHSLAIEPTVQERMRAMASDGHRITAPVVAELMKDLYRSLVNDQTRRFAQLFEHLLAEDVPVVFHCTAGKDRTGFAAALILLALGVPRQTVMQDYLLTNQVFQHAPQDTDIPPDALAVLWRVQEGFLDAALRIVDADHGGVERYLDNRLGLSATALVTLGARYLIAE
jgi:protein-tyrosine phosphatase